MTNKTKDEKGGAGKLHTIAMTTCCTKIPAETKSEKSIIKPPFIFFKSRKFGVAEKGKSVLQIRKTGKYICTDNREKHSEYQYCTSGAQVVPEYFESSFS